jgi:hypothetical protein
MARTRAASISKAENMSSKVGQQQGRRAFGRLAGRVAAAGVLAAAALAAGLTGCASLETRDVTLSESEITLLLARQFPMERKVLEVIDLTVSNPQVRLLPDSNRIGTELDVAAVDRLFGNTAHAHVNLDYGLRFEPSDHSIRMTQVRVRELTLDSGANSMHGVAQRLGTLAAENALENQTLYKMKPAQADAMDRLNLVASPIRVTSQGLSMTVSPKPN